MYNKILKEILSHKNKDKNKILSRFFKTGKGEYGEGDKFLGIIVPESRIIAIKYNKLSFSDIEKLLKNKYHEIRLIALLILVYNYKTNKNEKKKIYNFYLKNTTHINNWDLVDLSAHYIIGDYLIKNGNKKILEKLARSKNIWKRRIAIVSTFAFIHKNEYEWTFKVVDILKEDKHDLIQKACGWMLREVGKRVSEEKLTKYLDKNNTRMPRTMLRYAIERLPKKKRLYYLNLNK